MRDATRTNQRASWRSFFGVGTAGLMAAGAPALQAQVRPAGAAQPRPTNNAPTMIPAGKDSAGYPVELSFVDYGKAKPVVLIHGWPL